MGESKIRQKLDPNYGKPPEIENTRALLISSKMTIQGSKIVMDSDINPQELRFGLLFWDKLAWPHFNSIHLGGGDDEEYLLGTGALVRPYYEFTGDVAQGIAKGHVQLFQQLQAEQPGVWALAQGENSFNWAESFLTRDQGASVELHRAIPIPQYDVPINEILELKEKRKDELLLFRSKLESFVTQIETSKEPNTELDRSLAELDEACSNLIKLGKEWQFPVTLSNFKASFNLTSTKLSSGVATGWYIGQNFGLGAATVAASLGGVISTLDIKADFGKQGIKAPTNPYKYAYHINKELL
ncbi:DUF6236 family protein [Methylophilus methylotrophus]|uniref:DUF6236 family protein n=1 Tax=Methylophilus methylotrophus TaxID=17 RepID=UPI000F5A7196|nr:DUF6236 family protein [Methylophilus methylotrophus]